MRNRVTAGRHYVFIRNGYDRFDAHNAHVQNGTELVVTNLPGAPRANTMGHCHANYAEGGAFAGMFDTASLYPVKSDEARAWKFLRDMVVGNIQLTAGGVPVTAGWLITFHTIYTFTEIMLGHRPLKGSR
jgi:hypothetical protein